MRATIPVLAAVACVASAQEYQLVLVPEVDRCTAVTGTVAYGDRDLAPSRNSIWRGLGLGLKVPGDLPAVVYDSDQGYAVGYCADVGAMATWGLIWDRSGRVTVVDKGAYRHATVFGAGAGVYVGSVSGPGVRASSWDGAGHRTDMHPPGYSISMAEDVSSNGLVVGVVNDTIGVIWTGLNSVSRLPTPDWASVQSRPRAVNAHGLVVGDATGDVTRPVMWSSSGPVVLSDQLGFALDINDSGLAVGWVGDHGAVWHLPASADSVDANALHSDPTVHIIALYEVDEDGNMAGEAIVGGMGISAGVVLVRLPATGVAP